MPKPTIDGTVVYLDDVLTLWDELALPADFKVGERNKAQVTALRDAYSALVEAANTLQTQLDLKVDERNQMSPQVSDFAVQFRAALIAKYGSRSTQVSRVPKFYKAAPKKRTPAPGTTP